jgi:hypothetical protein
MKKGGRFWGVLFDLYYCSHVSLSDDVSIALNNKELHKKYSMRDYFHMDYWCDVSH